MGLLELAGGVCLAMHYGEPLITEFGKKLLPDLQALAAPNKNGRSLVEFWERTTTLYLNKAVVVTLKDGKTHSGILKGASTRDSEDGFPLCPHTYRLRISGANELDLSLDMKDLASGKACIHVDETVNATVNEKADDGDFEEISSCEFSCLGQCPLRCCLY